MSIGNQFQSILEAAQLGAEWAVAELYLDLQPSVLRYLRLRAPNGVEDVASETWLSVMTGLARFSGREDAFRGWVFTIARRRLVDSIRQSSRAAGVFSLTAEVPERAGPDDTESTVMATLATETALSSLAVLPCRQAAVVRLRVLGGLDAQQVGAIVDRRPAAVRVLQHRGLSRLAREVGPPAASPPTSAMAVPEAMGSATGHTLP